MSWQWAPGHQNADRRRLWPKRSSPVAPAPYRSIRILVIPASRIERAEFWQRGDPDRSQQSQRLLQATSGAAIVRLAFGREYREPVGPRALPVGSTDPKQRACRDPNGRSAREIRGEAYDRLLQVRGGSFVGLRALWALSGPEQWACWEPNRRWPAWEGRG